MKMQKITIIQNGLQVGSKLPVLDISELHGMKGVLPDSLRAVVLQKLGRTWKRRCKIFNRS
jgi:hypothetical protein